MNQWYAITLKAGPFVPARGLREQGFRIFLPKRFIPYRPPGDARRLLAKPILRFDGYMFVLADYTTGELGPISNTRGVGGFVPQYPAAPYPIPADVIEDLRAAEDEEYLSITERMFLKTSPYPLGSKVRVMRGTEEVYGHVLAYRPNRAEVQVLVGSAVVFVSVLECQAVEEQKEVAHV